MSNELRLGLIGFGEAGYRIALGLQGAGLTGLAAYDPQAHLPGRGESMQARATEAGVALCASMAELAAQSDVLFSVVTASAALEAAEQVAPYLNARHLYADLNTVGPATKGELDQLVRARQARFVEAAMMAQVPLVNGHQVAILLSGPHAQLLVDQLKPWGMRLEIVAEQIGSAMAVKLLRNIVVQGMEALLCECALGATKYGVDAQVFTSLDSTWPGVNWGKLAGSAINRIAEDGERRARELSDAAASLRTVGVEPIMVEATVKRQAWGAQLGLFEHFDGAVPTDYRVLAQVIEQK